MILEEDYLQISKSRGGIISVYGTDEDGDIKIIMDDNGNTTQIYLSMSEATELAKFITAQIAQHEK